MTQRHAPKKALLVDGPDDRRVFRRFLQLHGFDVEECDSLEEAKVLASRMSPDVLIAALTWVRDPAWGSWRGGVPVIYHGGVVSEWDALPKAFTSGAAFLAQPFSLLDFHLAIREVLRPRAGADPIR